MAAGKSFWFMTALILGALASRSAAQSRPDPHEIPVPPIKTPGPELPGVNDLPVRPEMPDVLVMNDGTKVTTLAQWARRREEMKRILSYYAVGHMPPPPGNVKGRELKAEAVLDGKVKYRLVRLTFGPGEKLSLDIGIFTPAEGGPFPAIILQHAAPGGVVLPRFPAGPNQGTGQDVLLLVGPATADTPRPLPPPRAPGAGKGGSGGGGMAESVAGQYAEVFRRGYALAVYSPYDCAEDTTQRNLDGSWSFRDTRFFPAYPGYDWGILAGWAWGASRVADYLETDSAIDGKKLIITGQSRLGKSSMIAAAFDDRLMAAPVVTGGGGIGAYRFTGPRDSETIDILVKKYPNWFSPHLHEFWGQPEKLPFDEHWFLALCAPKPFLALEGDTDVISLPDAVRHSLAGARPVYELFGEPDRLGVNYSHHGHAFTTDDWTALMDFADKHLRGMKVDRTFDHYPPEPPPEAAGEKL